MPNLPPSKSLVTPTTNALSQGLRLLLEAETSADDAVSGILANPALHAETKAALPMLLERTKGCGEPAAMQIIARRFATFPQSERTDEEWANWWGDYFDACADQPAEALEAAMKAWVRTDKTGFLPKPGQLRELALKAAGPLWQAANRARRAAYQEPKRFSGPKADPAEVQALLDTLGATVKRSPQQQGNDQ